jgi:DNA modification methylase
MPKELSKRCVLAGCPTGGVVLDPFTGSGTVGIVAMEHGCDFVGIELNPAYVEIARARLTAAQFQGRLDFGTRTPSVEGGKG